VDPFGAGSRAHFYEIDELNETLDNRGRNLVFHLAGADFRRLGVYRKYFREELAQRFLTPHNVPGSGLAQRGQRDQVVRGVVDQAAVGECTQRSGYRRIADAQAGGDILGACGLFHRDDAENRLQIIFEARTQDCRHIPCSRNNFVRTTSLRRGEHFYQEFKNLFSLYGQLTCS